MLPEHEEAMRVDFAERAALDRQLDERDMDAATVERVCDRIDAIDDRWDTGPHAKQWRFLGDAYAEWDQRPVAMREHLERLRRQHAAGHDIGMSEVEYRSVEQAGALIDPQLTQQQHQQRPQRSR
ncbi:hypothetical protein [Nocardia cerradoensis]|uniref:Uncharacterized protein n=1 Tax=Nocardia cerradoensis TaxID=85688 RepID=A0A231GVJ0_9NOCA|nr:hypothetical protein [Nocardia cerradoensis]NKY48375.1 hypothetical protein [Nocardia cerradoensis]OXR40657.1 hypothetical protein B7C42_07214 [Nocardia cerradoensis]